LFAAFFEQYCARETKSIPLYLYDSQQISEVKISGCVGWAMNRRPLKTNQEGQSFG
jgi:hypothetical protein